MPTLPQARAQVVFTAQRGKSSCFIFDQASSGFALHTSGCEQPCRNLFRPTCNMQMPLQRQPHRALGFSLDCCHVTIRPLHVCPARRSVQATRASRQQTPPSATSPDAPPKNRSATHHGSEPTEPEISTSGKPIGWKLFPKDDEAASRPQVQVSAITQPANSSCKHRSSALMPVPCAPGARRCTGRAEQQRQGRGRGAADSIAGAGVLGVRADLIAARRPGAVPALAGRPAGPRRAAHGPCGRPAPAGMCAHACFCALTCLRATADGVLNRMRARPVTGECLHSGSHQSPCAWRMAQGRSIRTPAMQQ